MTKPYPFLVPRLTLGAKPDGVLSSGLTAMGFERTFRMALGCSLEECFRGVEEPFLCLDLVVTLASQTGDHPWSQKDQKEQLTSRLHCLFEHSQQPLRGNTFMLLIPEEATPAERYTLWAGANRRYALEGPESEFAVDTQTKTHPCSSACWCKQIID